MDIILDSFFVIANPKYNRFLYVLLGERDRNSEKVRVNSDTSPQRQNITADNYQLYRVVENMGECALEQNFDIWIITEVMGF